MGKKHSYYRKSMSTNFSGSPHTMDLVGFFRATRNWLEIDPHYRKSIGTDFPAFPHSTDLPAFSHTMENWWENACISHLMKYTIGWESAGSPNTMRFVGFSCIMRNWWGNPCISHMMKHAIGWELDGKKANILWEKYEYQFPRFSPYVGFCSIFQCYV